MFFKSSPQAVDFAAVKAQESSNPPSAPQSDLGHINSIFNDSSVVITIIGDGSKTTLQVVDANTLQPQDIEYAHGTLSSIIGGSANVNNVGLAKAKENLAQILDGLSAAKIGPNKLALKDLGAVGVVSGIAGFVSNADNKDAVKELLATYGIDLQKIYLGGDVELAKQLITNEGAILISGTGSICFSKANGMEKRIGGYGPRIGDQGSGFKIGNAALEKALNAHFQPDLPPFALTDKLLQLFDIPVISDAIKPVYAVPPAKTITPADIAKVFPLVFDAAFKSQDADCQEIIDNAAQELANHIKAAVRGVSIHNFPVYLINDVFKNEHAHEFIEMISEKVAYAPGLELVNLSEENMAVQVRLRQVQVVQTARLTA